jgi:hypothetical protein
MVQGPEAGGVRRETMLKCSPKTPVRREPPPYVAVVNFILNFMYRVVKVIDSALGIFS